MNKSELIDTIAKEVDLSKAAVGRVLDALLKTITKALARKLQVVLVGFGTFKTSKRKARMGRNPQTGAAINIPASTVPVFKAGKALKDAVNK